MRGRAAEFGPVTGLIWLCSAVVTPIAAQSGSVPGRVIQAAPRATVKGVFTMSAKPVWDVGGIKDNPDEEFESRDAAVKGVMLANGGLAVFDKNKVRIFDATGKERAVVGRFGHGPNEFAQLDYICASRGDTLVVWDQNYRSTIISPTGTIVRQWPSGTTGRSDALCFDDGTVMLHGPSTRSGGKSSRKLSRSDLTGKVVKALGAFPTTFYGTTRMTEVTVSGTRSTFFVADPTTLDIQRYDKDGRLLSVLHLNEKAEAMTGKDLLPDFAPRNTPGVTPPPMPKLKQVTVWPFYDRVRTDNAGRWWIKDYPRNYVTAPAVWTAIDSTGKLLGRLTIPKPRGAADISVSAFTANGVFVKRRDADGAVHFTLYHLTLKPGP